MRSKGFLACVLALASAIGASQSFAQATASEVQIESVKGKATVNGAGLAEGRSVQVPATIATAPGAQVRLRFADDTRLALDERSSLRLVDVRQSGQGVRIVLDLTAGSARMVTEGNVTAGQVFVRTTHAAFEPAPRSDFSVAVAGGVFLGVDRGSVVARDRQGGTEFKAGSAATIRSPGALISRSTPADRPAPVSSALGRLASADLPAPSMDPAERPVLPEPMTRDIGPRFWVGGAVGKTKFKENIVGSLIDPGSGQIDTKSTGYKIFFGYQFLPHLAGEAAYVDLGKAKYQGTVGGVPVTDGKVKVNGLNFSAVGTLPLGDAVLFAKAGIFHWQTKSSDSGTTGAPLSAEKDGRRPSFGVGAGYNFKRVGLRAEYEKLRIGDTSASLISLGAMYRF